MIEQIQETAIACTLISYILTICYKEAKFSVKLPVYKMFVLSGFAAFIATIANIWL